MDEAPPFWREPDVQPRIKGCSWTVLLLGCAAWLPIVLLIRFIGWF